MTTILGTGQVGTAVLNVLLERNPRLVITLVNRSGALSEKLPCHVKVISADVTNKNDMLEIARRSEVIFNCTDVPYETWSTFYPATANALAYALRKTTAKLVFADNLYSYGNVRGEVMNEEMFHAAENVKGKIRASVINALLNSGEDFNKRVAFVKAADFVGPAIHKGLFGKDFLERIFHRKTVLLSGSIAIPHTFTYIHDFATALVNVGNAEDAFGQTWHAPNAPAMSLEKWLHLFGVMSNTKIKVTVVPKVVARVAGIFNSFIRELYELAYQFDYPYLVDHEKYVSRFGNHATSPSVIVKKTIQFYQSTYRNENN